MALNVDNLPGDAGDFARYMSGLTDVQLPALEKQLMVRFGEIRSASSDPDDDTMNRARTLGEQIRYVREHITERETKSAQEKADLAAAAKREALANLDRVIMGNKGSDGGPARPSANTGSDTANVLAEAIAAGVSQVFGQHVAMVASSGTNSNLNKGIREMSLGQVGRSAPDPKVAPVRSEAVLLASADIPGRALSSQINGITELTKLMGARARMLSTTRGNPNYVPVATLQRDHRFSLSLDSTPEEINEVLTAATDVGALVAAGGWCAPSEISYDFFNIVCEDGMVDLPSVGVLNRGGFRFPTSPTIADIFSDPNALWSWTEQQDIDAVTSDSDVKTCARVPCPDFEEVRAACDGLCVTAGNLTDFAYPELVENFIRLVMAGRAHVTNQSVIAQMVAASTAVPITSSEGATSAILNSLELQAFDYRERFRMCGDAVLEAVFPRWAYGVIRADLANRVGIDMLGVTNGMIADWFDLRGIRAQFVADWQAGFVGSPIGAPGAIATAWPDTMQYLLYAPGTFVRGQGLQLDLGVVRDSVLNEVNDHTAAWMEDCYAVAMVGHESRLITVDLCTAGVTGSAELTCA